MRFLLKAKYIILSVLFLILLLVGTKSGWLVQRYTFAKAIRHDFSVNTELKADLQRCLRSCSQRDKAFAERFLENVINPMETQNAPIESRLAEVRKILLESATHYTEIRDVRNAVEVYDTALDLNTSIQFEPERDLAFFNEVHTAIERLVARFPRNGHAYYIWGRSLFLKNSRDQKSLAAFKKCLSILPTETACQEGFEKALEAYTEARCEVSGLAPEVKIALDKKDSTTETTDVATLPPQEISEVWPASNKEEQQSLMVRFTDSGMAQLRKAYRDGSANSVSLKMEDKTLATAVLSLEAFLSSNAIRFESVQFAEAQLPVFETICRQPQHPELPQKLVL